MDEIARCMMEELDKGSRSADFLATTCGGGAIRMTAPRLTWLEGLGLAENVGGGQFAITPLGKKFVQLLV